MSGILKLSMPFYKLVATPKWRRLVESEDAFYSTALELVDDAVLRLKEAVEKRELKEDEFYFLSYLMSKVWAANHDASRNIQI